MASKCEFTFRQRQIIWGRIAGLQNKDIAAALGMAPTTVGIVVSNILVRMGIVCSSHGSRGAFLEYLHASADRTSGIRMKS